MSHHPPTRLRRERLLSLALVLLLSGCALMPQPDVYPPEPGLPAPAAPAAPPAATAYRIVAADLEIHTYRAGWLAGMAHNHVMETTAVSGEIHLGEDIENSTARLYFRPWDLELDNPASRAAAGAGFESSRTAEDIAATRTRMLGPRGFDSNGHPFVVIDVAWRAERVAALTIRFRDAAYELDVPVTWELSDGRLDAAADFELSHRALGIRPYSAFAGALAVAEPIRIQLSVSGRLDSSI